MSQDSGLTTPEAVDHPRGSQHELAEVGAPILGNNPVDLGKAPHRLQRSNEPFDEQSGLLGGVARCRGSIAQTAKRDGSKPMSGRSSFTPLASPFYASSALLICAVSAHCWRRIIVPASTLQQCEKRALKVLPVVLPRAE